MLHWIGHRFTSEPPDHDLAVCRTPVRAPRHRPAVPTAYHLAKAVVVASVLVELTESLLRAVTTSKSAALARRQHVASRWRALHSSNSLFGSATQSFFSFLHCGKASKQLFIQEARIALRICMRRPVKGLLRRDDGNTGVYCNVTSRSSPQWRQLWQHSAGCCVGWSGVFSNVSNKSIAHVGNSNWVTRDFSGVYHTLKQNLAQVNFRYSWPLPVPRHCTGCSSARCRVP